MNRIIEILGNNFIGLLIGTLLGKELTRFLYRPQVLIQLRNINTLHSDNGFFISIRIANRGRTAALNCIGNITINFKKENLMNPADYKLDEFEESLPKYSIEDNKIEYPRHQLVTQDKIIEVQNSSVCWSKLGNPQEVNINPGSNQNLDICRIQHYVDKNEQFWYLIFPCEEGWRKVRCRIKLNPKELLNGKLFICPNNVFPTVRKIIFNLEKEGANPKFIIKEYGFLERLYYTFNRNRLYFD